MKFKLYYKIIKDWKIKTSASTVAVKSEGVFKGGWRRTAGSLTFTIKHLDVYGVQFYLGCRRRQSLFFLPSVEAPLLKTFIKPTSLLWRRRSRRRSRRVRTSSDSVKTSLCWEPRSSFWSTGRSPLLTEDSGTNLANCWERQKYLKNWLRRNKTSQEHVLSSSYLLRFIQDLAVLLKPSGLGVVMASKSTNWNRISPTNTLENALQME